ncbi:GGDEF domain-containing protein [Nakamurella lactea]|uniref:GGDEF domain-containing protein n=1 Tax=Nakamurella lactea TaxID=459515 RepID=UPI000409BFC7|nr:GGDEF domain-containing protein [Nakamurella lactea]
MQYLERAWQQDHRVTRARLLSLLYALGGALCLLVVLVRQNPQARYEALAVFGGVGLVAAGLLLVLAARIPTAVLTGLINLYSLLIATLAAIAVTAVGVLGLAPAMIATCMYLGYFATRRSLGWQVALSVVSYCVGARISGTSPLLMGIIPAVIVAVAVSLVLSQLTQRLRRTGSTDSLTGALNRTWLVRIAEYELRSDGRRPLSIVLLDLDHFKSVNDEHGHLAGDALLASVARAWSTAIGDDGMLGRFGGDEFLVLLPDTPGSGLTPIVRRLEQAHPAHWSSGTTTSRPGDDLPSLLARADANLIAAKRGRSLF